MTRQVNVHEAKATLSELLAAVERGEEVIIARRGKPIAKLGPCSEPSKKRNIELGFFRDQVREIDPDWWKPVEDDEIREFCLIRTC